MIGVGVGVMMMIVAVSVIMPIALIFNMLMAVTMAITVIILVIMGMMHMGGGVKIFVRYFAGTDALHVMMVAFLLEANFSLKAQDLLTVFTHLTVHVVGTVDGFLNPIRKGVQYQGVVVQIRRLDEFNIGMASRNFIHIMINATHQDAGK